MNAPRDPRFPPVGMLQQRQPWGVPQTMPNAPASLPMRRGRSSAPGAGGIVEVRNDHNYASVIDLAVAVDAASVRVLDQPTGLRNLLMFRNASPGTQNIFIGFGKDATATSTLLIVPGQMVLFDFSVPQDDVFALSSAAGGILCIAYSTIPEV